MQHNRVAQLEQTWGQGQGQGLACQVAQGLAGPPWQREALAGGARRA